MSKTVNLDAFLESIAKRLKAIEDAPSVNLSDVSGLNLDDPSANTGVFTPNADLDILIAGSDNTDSLEGTDGANIIIAKKGNDTLIGKGGIDLLLGGEGIDTADYSYLTGTQGVFVDLAFNFSVAGTGDIDLLKSIENAIGSQNADVLMGNGLNNVLLGNGGNDYIDGRGGSHDVVQLFGSAEDYTFTATTIAGKPAYTISREVERDGTPTTETTTIVNIEYAQFEDGTSNGVKLLDLSSSLIARDDLYEGVGEDDTFNFNVLDNDEKIGDVNSKAVITSLAFGDTSGQDQDGVFVVSGDYGTVNINKYNGAANFIGNDKADTLAAGEVREETYTYTTLGGDTATITIQIAGMNDKPVISASSSAQITEADGDNVVATEFNLDVNDVDHNSQVVAVRAESDAVLKGDSNGLSEQQLDTLKAGSNIKVVDGNYQYSAGSLNLDSMALGQVLTLTYQVAVQDEQGAWSDPRELTITISGQNDAPSITSSTNATMSEGDGEFAVKTEFSLTVTDVDAGATVAAIITANGEIKGNTDILTADQIAQLTAAKNIKLVDGKYVYDAGLMDLDALPDGKDLVVTYSIKVQDKHGATSEEVPISITITGSNDSPVLYGPAPGLLTIQERDADTPNSDSLVADGSVKVFDPDTEVSSLSVSFSDDVTVKTSHPNLTIPAMEVTAGVIPNGSINKGKVFYSFEINDTAKLDHLGAGETITATYTMVISDGVDGSEPLQVPVTLTIEGANDRPIATAMVHDEPLTEDGTDLELNASGDVLTDALVSDADINDLHSVSKVGVEGSPLFDVGAETTVEGKYGVLTIKSDGSYSYRLFTADDNAGGESKNEALQALKADDQQWDVFEFVVQDDSGDAETSSAAKQKLTFEIIGTNDAPIAKDVSDTTILEEDSVDNTIAAVSDPDAGLLKDVVDVDSDPADIKVTKISNGSSTKTLSSTGDQQASATLLGTFGTLIVYADGTYKYELASANSLDSDQAKALNALREGQEAEETFSFTVSDGIDDGLPKQLSFNITGTNDAPVLIGANTAFSEDDGTTTLTGIIAIEDADAGDTHSIARVQPVGIEGFGFPVGGLSANVNDAGDLEWIYTANNDHPTIQGLADGEIRFEQFEVTIDDDTAQVTTTVTITITGQNDAPTFAPQTEPVTLTDTDTIGNTINVLGEDGLNADDIDGDNLSVDLDTVSGALTLKLGGEDIVLPLELLTELELVTLQQDGELSLNDNFAQALEAMLDEGNAADLNVNFDITDGLAPVNADFDVHVDGSGEAQLDATPPYGTIVDGEMIVPDFLLPTQDDGSAG
ncbi:VCBS domain-containing protein [Polycladidibacter hongkongensis]|uniref:VCBS domain-containing protein n=1 Tax=Polycladidibacter hongkongensis TaxID=1647556 RepID=UPI00082A7154|nr:VCBS domain-containing protein [Pseudovibrio hongkongensis]